MKYNWKQPYNSTVLVCGKNIGMQNNLEKQSRVLKNIEIKVGNKNFEYKCINKWRMYIQKSEIRKTNVFKHL